MARQIPHVRVVDEPRKRLVVAREAGRRAARGGLLVYLDADCRAPLTWVERVERRFRRDPSLVALSAPYRFYDWDRSGRLLLRVYDLTVAPATQFLAKHCLRIGTVFYGGNVAVRREALERIGGFDTSIEFHGEDTNLRRRLSATGDVALVHDCYVYTSARRYVAMGKRAVFVLYVRNFISELLHRELAAPIAAADASRPALPAVSGEQDHSRSDLFTDVPCCLHETVTRRAYSSSRRAQPQTAR